MREFELTGKFEIPKKLHFIEVLEGMCQERNLKNYDIKATDKKQNLFGRTFNKIEIITFKISGSNSALSNLNLALDSIFRNYNSK